MHTLSLRDVPLFGHRGSFMDELEMGRGVFCFHSYLLISSSHHSQ